MLCGFKTIVKKDENGLAAVLATLIILIVAIMVVGTLTLTTLTEQKMTKNSLRSAQAYYVSESGIEDSLYRILKGKNYQATNSLMLESGVASISISGNNNKTIRVDGEETGRFRNLQVKVTVSTDSVSFYYGAQVGEGGLTMSNGSKIIGSIYSNGSVNGNNNASITGDIWVANAPNLIDQQSTVGGADFIFGKQDDPIDAAQSFIPSISDSLIKISLNLKKVGNPGNKTVRILTDNGNKPSKTLVNSGSYGTLNTAQISQSSYGWIDVTMVTPPNLQAGIKYWIVIDTSADNNNYFLWNKDLTDSYAQGTGKYSPNWNASSPIWTALNGDLSFRAWLGDEPNSLSDVTVGGNAYANTIDSCAITGDAFYQTISASSVGGTQHPNSPDPAMENMPISDSNISDWQADATAGGVINGNYNAVGVVSLGPKKITGDLTVANGADLTVTGTIYVAGNITISNSGKLRLGAGYGNLSGLVLTDGIISVGNNAVFFTNGAGSYLMLLSTKTGEAINISNNANTVIFYASNGEVAVANNVTLREVTAYKLGIANNAQITYESGLASAKFSSGTGAGWAVNDWQEVP